jgi:hypothetical protein
MLEGIPGGHLLFVGYLACTRHRQSEIGSLLLEGRLSILCPSASDFATGRYLHQIVDAIVEISQERGTKHFVLMHGCQCAVLVTDFELLKQELHDKHGVILSVHDSCRLCGHDERDEEEDEEDEENERGRVEVR